MARPYHVLVASISSFVVCFLIIENRLATLQSIREDIRYVENGMAHVPRALSHQSQSDDKIRKKPAHCKPYIGEFPDCLENKDSNIYLPQCGNTFFYPENATLEVSQVPLQMGTLEYVHGGDLEPGGLYRPPGCQPLQRVAIVVPYHDRLNHLKVLLNNLHPFLKTQGIQFMIIVIEQALGQDFSQFNRGMMKNIGFAEGEKICKFDCYFFHDIDLIPEVNENIYTCDVIPRHHSANLARWNHTLPYSRIFGGVVSFTREVFLKINGYSNAYFGWGGEDDDLYSRVREHGFNITRYPMNISKYTDLTHQKSRPEPSRWKYYRSWKSRMNTDGLNSLKYTRHLVEFKKLYTWVYVEINKREVLNTLENSTALSRV